MTADGCRQWRERLGALALGHLDEGERAATEAHLQGCAACREEAEAMRSLAGLLPLANPDRIAAPAPAPPAGLERRITGRIGAERRAQRRQRRRRLGFAFSGAAAALACAAIAVIALVSGGGGSGAEHVNFEGLPAGVQIGATLEPQDWGTQVTMEVSGMPSGTLCRVYLRRNDGRSVPVGSFRYRYSAEHSRQALGGALDISDVSAIEVRADRNSFVQPVNGGGPSSTSSRPSTKQEEAT
jgi:hypothetical protein